MNTTLQKTQYNGFKLDGTLMSRVKFSALVRISEISKRFLERGNDLIPYWSLSDEYGAKFSCFNEELVSKIVIMELYEITGEIKFGKGGTYLNLKTATLFNGGTYHESGNNESDISGSIDESTREVR